LNSWTTKQFKSNTVGELNMSKEEMELEALTIVNIPLTEKQHWFNVKKALAKKLGISKKKATWGWFLRTLVSHAEKCEKLLGGKRLGRKR